MQFERRLTSFGTEQGQYQPLSMEIQVPIIYAGVNGLVCHMFSQSCP
jgi:hypothetical protein